MEAATSGFLSRAAATECVVAQLGYVSIQLLDLNIYKHNNNIG